MKSGATLAAVATAFGFGLAACAPIPSHPSRDLPHPSRVYAADAEASAGAVLGLLRYVAHVEKLRGDDLKNEYELNAQALATDTSASNYVRMALVTSIPSVTLADDTKALALLQRVLCDNQGSTGLCDLTFLLAAMLRERIKVGEKLQAATERLRDERKRAESVQQNLTNELQVQTQKLKEEQARSEALERKIGEVKKIEKSMSERPPTTRRP